jgi:hypothetical protein
MMNKVYEEHSAQKCDKLNINLHCEQKLGLGSNWSPTMFEGKTLSGSARQAIRAFAKDIKARCSAIIENFA